LASNTNYYVYAFNNSGTVTGDFRTDGNGHITDTTAGNEGVEVRCSAGTTPDPTRTLIGLIRTSGTNFAASGATQFVLSWFNRRRVTSRITDTTARSVTATTMTEFASAFRAQFLMWAGEVPDLRYSGMVWINAQQIFALELRYDTTAFGAQTSGTLSANFSMN